MRIPTVIRTYVPVFITYLSLKLGLVRSFTVLKTRIYVYTGLGSNLSRMCYLFITDR